MSSILDTSIIINGVRLPNYTTCKRAFSENQVVNETLGGRVYVDFLNIRRSWQIRWDRMFRADYDKVYAFFLWQYANNAFPVLQIPAYNINGPAFLSISDQSIKYNGVLIEDFTLLVTEQQPFS